MKKSLIGQTFYILRNSSFDGGVEGNEFQLNTFKLFLLKAFNERHPNLYVWEDKEAGKYDDVLYSCEKDAKQNSRSCNLNTKFIHCRWISQLYSTMKTTIFTNICVQFVFKLNFLFLIAIHRQDAMKN